MMRSVVLLIGLSPLACPLVPPADLAAVKAGQDENGDPTIVIVAPEQAAATVVITGAGGGAGVLTYGATQQLSLLVTYQNGTQTSEATAVQWFVVSATDTVRVSSTGLLTANRAGSATVYCLVGVALSNFLTFYVKPQALSVTCVPEVIMSGGSSTCTTHGTQQDGSPVEELFALLSSPQQGGLVLWIAGNVVTTNAQNSGIVNITAGYEVIAGHAVTAETSFEAVRPSSVTLSASGAVENQLQVTVGATIDLSVLVQNVGDTSQYSLTWSSTDPSLYGVLGQTQSSMSLETHAIGVTTLRALVNGVEAMASNPLTITVRPASVTLSPEGPVTLAHEGSTTLTASARMPGGQPVWVSQTSSVSWSVVETDTEVVTVTAQFLSAFVQGVTPGTRTVRITLNGIEATAAVTVEEPPELAAPNPARDDTVLFVRDGSMFSFSLSAPSAITDLGSVVLDGGLAEYTAPWFVGARLVGIGQNVSGQQMVYVRESDGSLTQLRQISIDTGGRGESVPGSARAFGVGDTDTMLAFTESGSTTDTVNLFVMTSTGANVRTPPFSDIDRAAPTPDGRIVISWFGDLYLVTPPANLGNSQSRFSLRPLTSDATHADRLLCAWRDSRDGTNWAVSLGRTMGANGLLPATAYDLDHLGPPGATRDLSVLGPEGLVGGFVTSTASGFLNGPVIFHKVVDDNVHHLVVFDPKVPEMTELEQDFGRASVDSAQASN